jgi:plastocyanin
VVQGGGSLASASTTTNSQGETQNVYTLGPNAGPNDVQATVQGANLSVTFVATGTPPPLDMVPASIDVVAGDAQSATIGTVTWTWAGSNPHNVTFDAGGSNSATQTTGTFARAFPSVLANPLLVVVRNAGGNVLAGIDVDWEVTAGGGTLLQATVATNAAGESGNAYTVGPNPGTNTIRASVQSDPSLTVTFSATGAAAGGTVQVGDNFFDPTSVTVGTGTADQSFTYFCTIHGRAIMSGTVVVQ